MLADAFRCFALHDVTIEMVCAGMLGGGSDCHAIHNQMMKRVM